MLQWKWGKAFKISAGVFLRTTKKIKKKKKGSRAWCIRPIQHDAFILFVFLDKVLCSPDSGLKLNTSLRPTLSFMILLPPLPKDWYYRHAPHLIVFKMQTLTCSSVGEDLQGTFVGFTWINLDSLARIYRARTVYFTYTWRIKGQTRRTYLCWLRSYSRTFSPFPVGLVNKLGHVCLIGIGFRKPLTLARADCMTALISDRWVTEY